MRRHPSTPAPGSPGFSGYALAIGVSLLALGVEIPVGQTLNIVSGRASWSTLGSAVVAGVVIIVAGAIPAMIIGPVGALVVHGMTVGVSAQGWHVISAAFVGLSAGALLLNFHNLPLAVMLGVATGIGRLAAVPLARERARLRDLDRPQPRSASDVGVAHRVRSVNSGPDYGPDYSPDRSSHRYDDI